MNQLDFCLFSSRRFGEINRIGSVRRWWYWYFGLNWRTLRVFNRRGMFWKRCGIFVGFRHDLVRWWSFFGNSTTGLRRIKIGWYYWHKRYSWKIQKNILVSTLTRIFLSSLSPTINTGSKNTEANGNNNWYEHNRNTKI